MKSTSLVLLQSLVLLIGSVRAADPVPGEPQRNGVRAIIGTLVADSDQPQAQPETHFAIGVVLDVLQEGVASHLGLEAGHGLIVRQVMEKSAAEEAGIQLHDILLQANDKPLKEMSDLVNLVREGNGEPVKLTWLHAGEKKAADITPRKTEFPPIDAGLAANQDVLNMSRLILLNDNINNTGGIVLRGAPGFDLEVQQANQQEAFDELKTRLDKIEKQLEQISQLLQSKAQEEAR